ncbi:ABC transporter ATP-binding protein [Candidatus Parcubacteria bacterium]|nr:ABC transporter ATP-binding protein [Patescibacteria group bacterium]MBU4309844.1 ABC transporter ATP-binding protein [Patescibacteria group bacterium]MBU4431983.1 ABC transporter ATP-binding protein [Patescibacteria group bacterium]MBU4578183.1 ABC transporter ATP-binding protein [Patescibacteria group bacterium]MCG2696719.1 ABC transporter ATP-binding protein [Candidatus Parcubacteria bacterium]
MTNQGGTQDNTSDLAGKEPLTNDELCFSLPKEERLLLPYKQIVQEDNFIINAEDKAEIIKRIGGNDNMKASPVKTVVKDDEKIRLVHIKIEDADSVQEPTVLKIKINKPPVEREVEKAVEQKVEKKIDVSAGVAQMATVDKKKTSFFKKLASKFFNAKSSDYKDDDGLPLVKRVQKVFEEGLREEYLKIGIERRKEISRNGDALVAKVLELNPENKKLSQAEYDKLADNIRVYILYWLSSFALPNKTVENAVEVKFDKIVKILKLEIIQEKNNKEAVIIPVVPEAKKVLKSDPESVILASVEKTVEQPVKKELSFREMAEVKAEEKSKIQPVISLKNIDIKYNFGKPTEYYAIKNASVDIYAGELIIFFGPSGCGKSTLVNAIAGLERPVGGTVEVMGKNILNFNYDQMADYHADTIGFVFQAYNLIESLSVEDNIIFPQMFRNVSRSQRKKKAQDLLDRFEIRRHAKKSPVMLSGGQQQRVGIARALVNDPVIILADEPMGNLDSASADIVVKIFRDLSKIENKTVILVTHNPELLSIANRIVYMKDGVIIREEVNDDVRPAEIKKEKEEEKVKDDQNIPVELRNLLKIYGGITSSQLNSMWIPLKAKMITDQILQKYTREQIEFIENVIKRRLMGIIPREEVFSLIDLPIEEGGAGLDKRSAETLADKIEMILLEVEMIKKYVDKEVSNPQESTLAEEDAVTEIRKQLLLQSEAHIIQKNIDNLEKFIRMRLENKIDKGGFVDGVSKPLALNGAGFGKSVAKKFARELELLMLIKFGEESESKPYKK